MPMDHVSFAISRRDGESPSVPRPAAPETVATEHARRAEPYQVFDTPEYRYRVFVTNMTDAISVHRPADQDLCDQIGGQTYQCQIWDTQRLPLLADDALALRVVHSEEQLTQKHYRGGALQLETTEHEWMWMTTLAAQAFPAQVVRRLGHDRWKQEINGWNDLTQNWALKHGYLRACRPHAVTENQERQPVPNCGLAAVALILVLAFVLCAQPSPCVSRSWCGAIISAVSRRPANSRPRCPSSPLAFALPTPQLRLHRQAEHGRSHDPIGPSHPFSRCQTSWAP